MNKQSIASKRMWEKISPEERSARMRDLAKKKWDNVSIKDRVRHARKMVKARTINKNG